MVVFVAPVLDEQAGLGERAEPVLVEAVVTEGAVEGFDEGVLGGFARLDVMEMDAGGLGPEVDGFAGELGAVVGGDGLWQAAYEGELLKERDDGSAADGSVGMECEALACEVIDEGEATEASAVGELVMDEVHAPAFIGSRRLWQRDACDGGQLASEFAAQGEAFLAVKALGAFVVDDQALRLEHIVEDGQTPSRL